MKRLLSVFVHKKRDTRTDLQYLSLYLTVNNQWSERKSPEIHVPGESDFCSLLHSVLQSEQYAGTKEPSGS